MTLAQTRGWLFLHPDLDARAAVGLVVTPQGRIALVEGAEAVRQALLLLLSTMPGERVMRPDYGCELHRLLFSPNDDTTAGLAIFYVRRAVERWEPRVELLRVDALRNSHRPELLDVILDYRIRATQHPQQLTFSLALTGEEV
jgi:phage baseplate assembly protein W